MEHIIVETGDRWRDVAPSACPGLGATAVYVYPPTGRPGDAASGFVTEDNVNGPTIRVRHVLAQLGTSTTASVVTIMTSEISGVSADPTTTRKPRKKRKRLGFR